MEAGQTDLQDTAAAHGPVVGPVALGRRPLAQAVAPPLHHVEALGVPNVRLQPQVPSLPPVELQHSVSVAAPSPVALVSGVFFLLVHSFLRLR